MVWRTALVLLIMGLSAAGCQQPFGLASNRMSDPFLAETAHHDADPYACGRASVAEAGVIEQQTARLPLLHNESDFIEVGQP